MIWQLVNLENEDEETQSLMKSFDWYILPSANPDGYEYSHTTVSTVTLLRVQSRHC